ncbi:hypothetical protein BT93_H0308 [Corymbia citriodora subsp. variegata]|nr:hypothetical protein BT93_H0308 [Corymbia citriodora subsp. variegata]
MKSFWISGNAFNWLSFSFVCLCEDISLSLVSSSRKRANFDLLFDGLNKA